jgi:putative thioredoxin
MLELNAKTDAPADLIKDGSEATFMADVVDASQQVPVIVDFWAPWCGPCKALTPALEKAVTAAKGKVRLVKINIDQNQAIAAQLRIQSIPTVYAFFQGQPVDGFQGALGPAELQRFIDKLAGLSGDGDGAGGLAEAIAAAEEMLAQGAAVDAAQTFAAILGEDDRNAAAYAGLARAHLALGDVDQAEAVLNGAPADIADAPEIEAARAAIALARQAEAAGPVADLRARIAADPADHQARFDLATALYAGGDAGAAVDELLDLFRRDRDWHDGAARTQLLTIFEALKPNDPVALAGRRKLSVDDVCLTGFAG